MIIKFKNIGKVSNHKIHFNDINIIAGQNDTAKSTIGKALFALYAPNVSDKSKITTYIKELLFELTNSYDESVIRQEFSENKRVIYLLNLLTDEKQLNSLIVEETLNQTFNNSFNNLYTDQKLELYSQVKDQETIFSHVENVSYNYESNDKDTKVIFIDSMLSKVDIDYFEFLKNKSSQYKFGLNQMLYCYNLTNEVNIINQKTYSEEINTILKAFHKIFDFSKIEQGFYDLGKYKIPLNSQASGTKNLYYIYRLICNGQLDENTILILDEPEDELHPEWQFLFSQIMILINELLKTKIIITTHSSEQIESVFSLMAASRKLTKLSLFISEKVNNDVYISNHSNDPEMLYASLNTIYDKIDSLEDDE